MLWPNLNSIGKCFVVKVGKGQRLWNCANSQILEGYPWAEGTDGKEVVKLF